MEVDLTWANGTRGRIIHSMWSKRLLGLSLSIEGERGRIHVVNPILPSVWHRLTTTIDGKTQRERVEGKQTYYYQLLEFQARVHAGQASTDLADSVANMELIDAIYTKAGLPLRGV